MFSSQLISQQVTTVTKFTNQDGNRLNERIVTSTVFGGKDSQSRFNNLTDAQFRGTDNNFNFLIFELSESFGRF